MEVKLSAAVSAAVSAAAAERIADGTGWSTDRECRGRICHGVEGNDGDECVFFDVNHFGCGVKRVSKVVD